jgi:predicted nucleotidyltransferase
LRSEPSGKNEALSLLSNRQSHPATPYTIEKIREIVSPIARRFGVDHLWLFGSYARGDFTPDSDLDFRLDKGAIRGYFQLGGFHNALVDALGMKIDLVETDSLEDEFLDRIVEDEVIIYERQN